MEKEYTEHIFWIPPSPPKITENSLFISLVFYFMVKSEKDKDRVCFYDCSPSIDISIGLDGFIPWRQNNNLIYFYVFFLSKLQMVKDKIY